MGAQGGLESWGWVGDGGHRQGLLMAAPARRLDFILGQLAGVGVGFWQGLLFKGRLTRAETFVESLLLTCP